MARSLKLKMKKIAFVTSSVSPEIASDDTVLAAALAMHDIQGVAAAWDDPAIDWSVFDMILIRSCWNYHLAPQKFNGWINAIATNKFQVLNPSELILWNLNKCYLRELEKKGIAIPDTEWITQRDFYPEKLADILAGRKWNRAVLKPCISASSFRTNIITPVNAKLEGQALAQSFPEAGMILQKFMGIISERGELSVIFFNGEYSHTVIKNAIPGEFRVQQQFGGMSKPVTVDDRIVESARKIIDTLPVVPLYARVDGFEYGGQFTLMELELIEPVLFFKFAPDAATRLVLHILKLI